MKKLLYIGMALALLAACKKSDNNTNTNTNPNITASIVGKWQYDADTINVYTNGNLQSTSSNDYSPNDYLQFNSNGTGTRQVGDSTLNFTYAVAGAGLTLTVPTSKTSSISKTQSIGTDVVTKPTTNITADIKLLNKTSLVLYFPQESSSNGGANITTEVDHLSK